MRNLLQFSILIFLTQSLFSQQINKELVVVEITTGTWCQYCPGAAMGADDLVENFGDAVAIIENHGGDSYENISSESRNEYYNVIYYPTAFFNGLNEVVGGDQNNTLYPDYLPVYNSAISDLTSFDVTMDIIPVNDYTFNVTVTIDKVYDYTGTNLVAHLVLTESHIQQSWQGMTELNFVNRAMFPNASGTTIDLISTNQQVINYTVTVDDAIKLEECELVAFVQDNSTKEILQGTKKSLNIPIGVNNVMLKTINYPTGDIEICEDVISPVITVKNRGSQEINSFEIEYQINSEAYQTQTWNGVLLFGETAEITLDEISYNPIESNILDINLTLPNGTNDDDLTNNALEKSFNQSIQTTSTVFLEIDPGGSFSLPWFLTNSEETIIYQGNASGSATIYETFNLNFNECYTFTFTSMMGNGIPGGGYFELTDQGGNTIYYAAGNSFTEEVIIPFKTSMISNLNSSDAHSFKIFPNPANKSFNISISDNFNDYEIIITDISGKILRKIKPENPNYNINTQDLSSGIYFVTVVMGTGNTYSHKLIINE